MGKEVFEKCYFCHAELKHQVRKTVVHVCSKREYTIKNEPHLACTKCTHSFQAEPYQYNKTNVFLKFLESMSLKKAEIEYRDMIQYVDNVLKFNSED